MNSKRRKILKGEEEDDEAMATGDPLLNNATGDPLLNNATGDPLLNNAASNFISIGAAIQAVQSLPDIDEELLFEAFDFLEKGKNAAMFITMNTKLRSKWLRKKLRPETIEILVKPISSTSKVTLKVSMWTTIFEVKAKFKAKAEYDSSSDIRLIFTGRQLEDGRTISDYGIPDGATVIMLQRM